MQAKSIEQALDVVELYFGLVSGYNPSIRPKIPPNDAITELNERFKEHGVGYQFVSGKIIRVDSEFLHVEAVKPALAVLRDDRFKGANEEFLSAHEHYRHGRYKESLVDALKSFESTLKTICSLREWSTQPTYTAKNLIDICLENALLPKYLESQLSSISSLLKSGVPTLRNKNAGHGQGVDSVAVPDYFARYALNLTATSILFIVEAHQDKK